jgi:hypothetical protein
MIRTIFEIKFMNKIYLKVVGKGQHLGHNIFESSIHKCKNKKYSLIPACSLNHEDQEYYNIFIIKFILMTKRTL